MANAKQASQSRQSLWVNLNFFIAHKLEPVLHHVRRLRLFVCLFVALMRLRVCFYLLQKHPKQLKIWWRLYDCKLRCQAVLATKNRFTRHQNTILVVYVLIYEHCCWLVLRWRYSKHRCRTILDYFNFDSGQDFTFFRFDLNSKISGRYIQIRVKILLKPQISRTMDEEMQPASISHEQN